MSNTKKPRKKAPVGKALMMSPCALKYAYCLATPFSEQARGACVPVGSSPSMKCHSYMRFDLTIGVDGVGYVYLCPSLASNLPSAFMTGSTYTVASGTYSPIATSATLGALGTSSTLNPGWSARYHNGPFQGSNFASGVALGAANGSAVAGKMVCGSVRGQYTGTKLAEGGLFYCYQDPAHESVSGSSIGTVGTFGDAVVEAVTRDPCTLVVHAVNAEEQNYSNAGNNNTLSTAGVTGLLYPYANGAYAWALNYGFASYNTGGFVGLGETYCYPCGVPIGIIGVTGTAGQSVHLEFIFHMEFTGPAAGSMLTPTSPDPVGSEMVRTASLMIPQRKLNDPYKKPWNLMYEALSDLYAAVKPVLIPAATAMLTALL